MIEQSVFATGDDSGERGCKITGIGCGDGGAGFELIVESGDFPLSGHLECQSAEDSVLIFEYGLECCWIDWGYELSGSGAGEECLKCGGVSCRECGCGESSGLFGVGVAADELDEPSASGIGDVAAVEILHEEIDGSTGTDGGEGEGDLFSITGEVDVTFFATQDTGETRDAEGAAIAWLG